MNDIFSFSFMNYKRVGIEVVTQHLYQNIYCLPCKSTINDIFSEQIVLEKAGAFHVLQKQKQKLLCLCDVFGKLNFVGNITPTIATKEEKG